MKSVVGCMLTLGFVLAGSESTGVADEPKEKGLQCETKHFDEKWNLKCKSVTYHLPVAQDSAEVRIVFEFTKDVDADTVKRIRNAFEQDRLLYVEFSFVDKDNAPILTRRFTSIAGEITGKSGEAFRVVIRKCQRDELVKTKKIEARLVRIEK